MKEVKVVSMLNFDGYVVDSHIFPLYEMDKLKEYLGNEEIIFVKGRNTFKGREIGDEFFNAMKAKLGY